MTETPRRRLSLGAGLPIFDFRLKDNPLRKEFHRSPHPSRAARVLSGEKLCGFRLASFEFRVSSFKFRVIINVLYKEFHRSPWEHFPILVLVLVALPRRSHEKMIKTRIEQTLAP